MYLLHDMGIEDVTMLEEKAVELGLEEVSTIFLRIHFILCLVINL